MSNAVTRGVDETRIFEAADGGGFDVRELISLLRRNALLMLGLGAIGAAGAHSLLARERPQFRAEALIRVRDMQAEATGGLVSAGEPRAGTGVSPLSEIIVLKGRQVASNVVEREGLRLFDRSLGAPAALAADVRVTVPAADTQPVELAFDDAAVTARVAERQARAPYGAPLELGGVRLAFATKPEARELSLAVVPHERAVDWLGSVLAARAAEGTDVINVSVTSPSPQLSLRAVNAVVREYQAVNAARARESNQRQHDYLEARLRESNDSLLSAQTTLTRFRTRKGVFDARGQSQAQRTGATDVERGRQQLEAEQRIRRALLAELDRAPRPSQSAAFRTLLGAPEVASSPIVARSYVRLADLETQRQELVAAGRPADHPDVVRVDGMLASVEAQLVSAMRSQVDALDARAAALGQVLREAAAEVSRLTPTEAEEIRLTEQVEAMRAVSGTVRAQLQRIRLAQAADIGQVEIVERATRALTQPTRRPLKLALGIAVGVLLGAGIGLFRHQLDTGLHRRVEVEQVLGVPGLGVVPQLPGAGGWRRLMDDRQRDRAGAPTAGDDAIVPDLVTVAHASDAAAGAYRALRTRLLFSNETRVPRVIVVTSAWSHEGKTTTAANLAVTFAQQGMRVLLVDGDLRRPRLHKLFGITNRAGLADVLLERSTMQEVVQRSGVPWLSVLTSGVLPSGHTGPSELLGGKRMTWLLAAAAQQFEITLIDSPPVLLASEACILAARGEATLLVLRAGRTGRALAQEAVQQLNAVGARIVGGVLNDVDARTPEYLEYRGQYRQEYAAQ